VESDDEDSHHGGIVMKNLRKKKRTAVGKDVKKNLPTSNKKDGKRKSQVSTPPSHDSFWNFVVHFMDLNLLKALIYLNILFGLSIFYVAE
jgi:hypothetical protein